MTRRLLRPHIDAYRAALAECRADLNVMHFNHLCELSDLRRELDQARAELDELKAAVRARQHAQAELAGLYRERSIQQARAVERDPTAPLN